MKKTNNKNHLKSMIRELNTILYDKFDNLNHIIIYFLIYDYLSNIFQDN